MNSTLRFISRALLATSVLSTSACVSGTIVGYGKRYQNLERANLGKVRKQLGAPAYSRSYAPSIPLDTTLEYKAYTKSKGDTPYVSCDKSQPVALCEVYTRTGPFDDMARAQAYGMIGGMTLGVGDVILLPVAINERLSLSKQKFSITFWYNEDQEVRGYFKGDIRNPESRW